MTGVERGTSGESSPDCSCSAADGEGFREERDVQECRKGWGKANLNESTLETAVPIVKNPDLSIQC